MVEARVIGSESSIHKSSFCMQYLNPNTENLYIVTNELLNVVKSTTSE